MEEQMMCNDVCKEPPMKEKKSYYAIIPADIRYDKRLKPNAKLLYGEITALCNERGYCWAMNTYFADLYEVKKETISRWIAQLKEFEYITVNHIKGDGNDKIIKRYIQISHGGDDKIVMGGIDEKVKDNTTCLNTTVNNKDNKPVRHKHGEYKRVLLTDEQLTTLKENYADWEERIARLDEYIEMSGKVYHNHLIVINNWARKDKAEETKKETVDIWNI